MSDDFKANIDEFCRFISPESETCKIFTEAYARLREEHPQEGQLFQPRVRSVITNTDERAYTTTNSSLFNTAIVRYLGDAVELFQRSSNFNDVDIAKLFAPATKQIRSLNHAAALLMDETIPFKGEDAAEYKQKAAAAARKVKELLGRIWDSAPAAAKRNTSNERVDVHGYSAACAASDCNKTGLAIIRKRRNLNGKIDEYDDRKNTVCDVLMTSEALLPHLFEPNESRSVFEQYFSPTPLASVTVHIVNKNGTVQSFDKSALGNIGMDAVIKIDNQLVKSYVQKMRWDNKEFGRANAEVTDEMIDFVENTLVPHWCMSYPPKEVNIPNLPPHNTR